MRLSDVRNFHSRSLYFPDHDVRRVPKASSRALRGITNSQRRHLPLLLVLLSACRARLSIGFVMYYLNTLSGRP